MENGADSSNEVEATGLEEFFTQPEFLFNLSHVHTLDSLYVANPVAAATNDTDPKVLTPPVSPNMYYSGEKPDMHFTTTNEKTVDLSGIRDSVSDTYDAWFSSGNMRSDELFPDLAI